MDWSTDTGKRKIIHVDGRTWFCRPPQRRAYVTELLQNWVPAPCPAPDQSPAAQRRSHGNRHSQAQILHDQGTQQAQGHTVIESAA